MELNYTYRTALPIIVVVSVCDSYILQYISAVMSYEQSWQKIRKQETKKELHMNVQMKLQSATFLLENSEYNSYTAFH